MSSKGKEEKKEDVQPETNAQDGMFAYDEKAVETFNKEKPWQKSVKHFSKCKISALAAMKMLKHSLAGVNKGRASQNGQPIEIMGLLIGKPDGDSVIVLDAFPLPVEGIEYKVEAADEAQGYMIQLMESLELRRKERFVGWYHSHPFDVDVKPNYFMSAMDVGTHTAWQHSIPTWTAIVVDPLRSLAKQEPELGAFRVYPATHNPPRNQGPDGTVYPNEAAVNERWGASSKRYYMLESSYFMSGLGNSMLEIMSRNNLWVRVLSSSSTMEPENRARFGERVSKASDKLHTANHTRGRPQFGGRRGRGGGQSKESDLVGGATACTELAIEQCKGHCSQVVKHLLFNYLESRNRRDAEREAKSAAASSSQMDTTG